MVLHFSKRNLVGSIGLRIDQHGMVLSFAEADFSPTNLWSVRS